MLFLLALAYLAPEQGMEISACLCHLVTILTEVLSVYISQIYSILCELLKGCFLDLLVD